MPKVVGTEEKARGEMWYYDTVDGCKLFQFCRITLFDYGIKVGSCLCDAEVCRIIKISTDNGLRKLSISHYRKNSQKNVRVAVFFFFFFFV